MSQASTTLYPHKTKRSHPSKSTFGHASYAAVRPTYPRSLYDRVLKYHQGPKSLCLDLGCGHGLVARELAPSFTKTIGIDPSEGMIETAHKLTPSDKFPNLGYKVSSAEDLSFVADASVDMVVAGQAAHWFDYPKLFGELNRVVRPRGTLAFWGYKDHAFVEHAYATRVLDEYTYSADPGKLGPYWPQPGRSIIQDKLRAMKPDGYGWGDVQRLEYEPSTEGKGKGQGTMFMNRRCTVGECKSYCRTWSCYHGWMEAHPDRKARKDGGEGDVVDELVDWIAEKVPEFKDEGFEVEIEWGSALVMARKGDV